MAALPGGIAARRRYRLLDSVAEVAFAEMDLAVAADAVLGGLATESAAQTCLAVRRAGRGWAVFSEGRVVARGPRVAQAIPALRLALSRLALGQASGVAAVHAAAVARGGKTVLLPAPAGSGKSTLAAACVLAGWELLADDTAVLDGSDGDTWLRPLPHALCLKPGAWPVLAACGAGLEKPRGARRSGTPAGYLACRVAPMGGTA